LEVAQALISEQAVTVKPLLRKTIMGICNFCGDCTQTAPVHYRQNTGMLIMRQSREWPGDACRACSKRIFWQATIHTFFLGWWGTISFFATPIFIIGNIISLTRSLRLTATEAVGGR
jgi:hypothetical protein